MNVKIKIYWIAVFGSMLFFTSSQIGVAGDGGYRPHMLPMLQVPLDEGSSDQPFSPLRNQGDESAQGSQAPAGIWQMDRWSPYVVGVLIGLLSWAAFLLSDKPLGVSTAYARTVGMLEEKIEGAEVREKAYYKQYVPKIDWEWMLVIGLFIGAYVSAAVSGTFSIAFVPPMWRDAIGDGVFVRWMAALGGGFLLGLGARWADGCTSGHGISGTLQLVVSSWVALICFFVGGVITAYLLYANV